MKKLILILSIFIVSSLWATDPQPVKLYPNPASSFVRINFTELIYTDVTVTLSDILGNKIETYTFKPTESIYLDLSDLKLINGMYLVKIQVGNALYLNRLMVKNN